MRRRLGILAALLALSCLVQAWMISRAVVPAQDCVRYVLMAQAYSQDGLLPALRAEAEHPLYPLLVWMCHSVRTQVVGSASWATSAQMTAASLLLISLVCVYFLLQRLVDEPSAIAGALFFCVMTPVARLGADALSDSSQLALISSAFYCIVRAWPPCKDPVSCRAPWLFAAGAMIGLAMLARAEAAVLLPALVLVLCGLQFSKVHRQRWHRLALCLGALVVGIAGVQVPYLAVTNSLSPDTGLARVLGRDQPPQARTSSGADEAWFTPDGQKMAFGLKDRSVSSRFAGYARAAREYGRELPEALQFWIGGLAFFGLWLMLSKAPARPWDWFLLVLIVLHSLAAVYFASRLGYLSARHLVPLVPLILAPAGYAAMHAGGWLWRRRRTTARWLSVGTVALAALACLPRTLAPLHPTRIGHRQAGEWLAAQIQSPGTVLDTRGWTGLYSGRPTLRYDAAQAAYRQADLAFVVVEQRELELNSARARTLVHLLGGAGERVALFSAPAGRSEDNVIVYRWRPELLSTQLSAAQAGAKPTTNH